MIPRATYRVQFTPSFGFDQAAALAPYLAKLGVSHLYASPYLKARPGSTHGYDIVDHNALNPELGDADAFERMHAALAAHGLKQILDFVPNHMGVGGADNPFWLDVLEWGPDSDYAGWFDIEWTPDRNYLRDKLLVPFLGEQFGAALEAGAFALRFDPEGGGFAVWAYDTHKLPIAPAHYGRLLAGRNADLARLGDAFANLALWRPHERRRAADLKAELADLVRRDPDAAEAIAAAVSRFAGTKGDLRSWTALDDLMRDQFWRPAYFRVAADDINYRRFFNIAELAGLRMEMPDVFDHTHRLVFDLLGRGVLDGLRIDHIDGLLDPKLYLQRLRAKAPVPADGRPFYLVVEKILAEGEPLRPDWPVAGTTGYEVTNQLLGLMVDPAGEIDFTRIYADFTGKTATLVDILRACKKQIMDDEMASELALLARAAGGLAAQNRKTCDFTRNILRRAIREIVACFPVYRTYLDHDGRATDEDRRIIDEAIAEARTHESAIDESVYAFLRSVLTCDLVTETDSGFSRTAVLRFAMKLQQYSGPVMAKGLEDTAFYRYNRFIALNEVGGQLHRFGLSGAAFHAASEERAAHWPHSMLGTSTHDTKRGEDARARLAALSEFPDEWADIVQSWSRCLRPEADRTAAAPEPDRNDEYALYQTLVGTVPPDLLDEDTGSAEGWSAYADRVKGAMTKSMREAKVHSTWASPNAEYEGRMLAFVDAALTGNRAAAFRASFVPFAARIARLGVRNSLVQTVLKLTIPGVPDIYQGTESWDLSMVDPDNRRPVDFAQRTRMLDEVRQALDADRPAALARMLDRWTDGSVKLATLTALLDLRRERPDLFASGSYAALAVEGPQADAVCAFVRRYAGVTLAVIVTLYPGRTTRAELDETTRVILPNVSGTWREVLTGRQYPETAGHVLDLLRGFPATVLIAS